MDIIKEIQTLRTTLISIIRDACENNCGCIEVRLANGNDFRVLLYNKGFDDHEVMVLYKILIDADKKLIILIDDIDQYGKLRKKIENLELCSLLRVVTWLYRNGLIRQHAYPEIPSGFETYYWTTYLQKELHFHENS